MFGRFDPYPYILLNLLLTVVSTFQSPLIMMSQNREMERDRDAVQGLHDKLDKVYADRIAYADPDSNCARVISMAGVLAGILHVGECFSAVDREFAAVQLAAITIPLQIRFADLNDDGVAMLAAMLAGRLMPIFPVTIHPDEVAKVGR